MRGVKRPAGRPREFRLDAAGYTRLGSRLRAADRAGERWQVTDAIRLLALTGCRRGEIMQLRRDEIDLTGKVLRLATPRRARVCARWAVPPSRSWNRRWSGLVASICSPRAGVPGPYLELPKAWRSIVSRRMPALTPHGLRHSFASVGEDCGLSIPTIGALLGHSGHGVTAGYIHKADAALIAAANRIADEIATMMEGAGHRSNVVEMAPRAMHG